MMQGAELEGVWYWSLGEGLIRVNSACRGRVDGSLDTDAVAEKWKFLRLSRSLLIQDQVPTVFQHVRDAARESGGGRAVDDSMIVG